MPTSPRKTRSRSRLVPGNHEDRSVDASGLSQAHLGVAAIHIPVMKASSMELVSGYDSGTLGKRPRHKMTQLQLQRLEELYQKNTHPSRAAKEALAREVGMTFKSVVIWFQNRRQDRRRKTSSTSASKAVLRRAEDASRQKTGPELDSEFSAINANANPFPGRGKVPVTAALSGPTDGMLEAASVPNDASSRVEDSTDMDIPLLSTASTSVRPLSGRVSRSPSSSLSSDSSNGSPHALWKLIVSSPPPPLPLPQLSVTPDCRARRPLGSVQGASAAPRKPDLEWACANSAARRKHGFYVYRDEDDSDGESSELEDRSARADRPPIVKSGHWRYRRTSNSEEQTVRREYEELLPPDLVLGAALLLTLKHSAEPARI
ncbi:hypothetical protein BD414DRAFT_521688 [Trametes punicea]|nr:hypothetical protein BD414DRAFT_521688 [Trametes punicea]